jgi:tetratricopeptide (TPR) repeat protein
MASIFRKLYGGRRKKTVRLSTKSSTESSHTSELEPSPKARKPQEQLLDDDDDDDDDVCDRTHIIQEQSPSKDNNSPPLTLQQQSNDASDGKRSGALFFPSTTKNPAPAPAAPCEKQNNSNNDNRKRSARFTFPRKKSDPKLQEAAAAAGFGRVSSATLKRRLRKDHHNADTTTTTTTTTTVPRRRIRVLPNNNNNNKASKVTTTTSTSTRLDNTGMIHTHNNVNVVETTTTEQQQNNQTPLQLGKEAERIARAAAALDNRGNELFERGYYDKAMEAYSKALKLKRRTFHTMLDEADDLLTTTEEDDEDLDVTKTDPKLLVSMATSINNIGYLRQRSGDATPDETMAAYKKSLRIKRRILGNDSLSVGKTLNNIGSVHYLKKDYEGAIPAYEEALHIMQATLGEGHPDVATVMSNMGDVHLAQKDPDRSLGHYRLALNIRWTAFGEHDPRVVRLLEKIAKIEIGDRMTPEGKGRRDSAYDWDDNDLFDLDMRPLEDELHLLHNQVEEDMQYVDLLQKKMAVDMVKDKVTILKGMRELLHAQENVHENVHESSHREDSEHADEQNEGSHEFSPELSSTTKISMVDRDRARLHVTERLARLRSQRNQKGESQFAKEGQDSLGSLNHSSSGLNHSSSGLNHHSSPGLNHHSSPGLDQSSSNLFGAKYYARNQRPALSTLQPDEIKGEVNNIRSALKLRKGIESLRSFNSETEENPKPVRAIKGYLGEKP